MSELQVFWWIQRLKGAIDGPNKITYKLLGDNTRTESYSVDYGAYMHDLARDIGADPSIQELMLKSPKSLIAWAMGQAYISFFRLRGPFATSKAYEISENELLRPVKQRPIISNLVFIGIFFIFLGANTAAALLSVLPLLNL
mmetsp:Transcript_15940/g.18898  ORF Transcript_15940/g.18898 Transcript_15940/m.18898 type:complete len:142 (+) Transcript_15940:75-500(+)